MEPVDVVVSRYKKLAGKESNAAYIGADVMTKYHVAGTGTNQAYQRLNFSSSKRQPYHQLPKYTGTHEFG